MALFTADARVRAFQLERRIAIVNEQQRSPRRGLMASSADGGLFGPVELAAVRVRMAIDAAFAESRPLKRVGSVRLATSVAPAATRFDVSRFEPVARLVMVEGDAHPTLHRMALLAPAIFHETVQLVAVRVAVAIYTQG
jgi:hypothetical protein